MKRGIVLFALVLVSGCGHNTPQLPSAPVAAVQSKDFNKADAPSLIRLGDRLLDAGDMVGASRMYMQAREKDPSNTEALIKLGDVAWRSGAFHQASGYYDQAAVIAPDNAMVLTRRARSYILQNQPEPALELLDKAIAGGDASAETHASKGLALDLMGQPEKAQLAYAEALDSDPENANLRSNTALSFALSGDYAAALEILRDLIDRPEAQAKAREALATVYALSGQTDVAVKLTASPNSDGAARRAFYSRLPDLSPREKAAAVYLRLLPPQLPAAGQVPTGTERNEKTATTEPKRQAGMPDMAQMNAPEPEPEHIPYGDDAKPAAAEAPEAPADTAPAQTEKPTETAPQAEAPSQAETVAAVRKYWVQMASFRTMAQVETAWKAAHKKLTKAEIDIAPVVQHVETGKGLFHRLLAGGFESKADADARCAALKDAGVGCFVTRNDNPIEDLAAALAKPEPKESAEQD